MIELAYPMTHAYLCMHASRVHLQVFRCLTITFSFTPLSESFPFITYFHTLGSVPYGTPLTLT